MSNWTAAALMVGTGAAAVALAHQSFPAAAPVAGTAAQAGAAGTPAGRTGASPQGTSGPQVTHSVATTTASGVTVTTTTRTVNGKTVVTQVRTSRPTRTTDERRHRRAGSPSWRRVRPATMSSPWPSAPRWAPSARVAVWPPENLARRVRRGG